MGFKPSEPPVSSESTFTLGLLLRNVRSLVRSSLNFQNRLDSSDLLLLYLNFQQVNEVNPANEGQHNTPLGSRVSTKILDI